MAETKNTTEMKAGQMADRIELWPVEKLTPYSKNARQHPEEQIEAIAKSITELGFNNPILVDSETGILAGHGRLKAALRVGMTEVPVIPLDHLSESQRKAFILVDNKTAEMATWDDGLLASEINALEREFEMSLDGLGWSGDELDDLRIAMDETMTLEDLNEMPELAAPPKTTDDPEADATEQEVTADKNYSEFLENYKNKSTRSLMLDYDLDRFEQLVTNLSILRDQFSVDNNADAIYLLVEETVK